MNTIDIFYTMEWAALFEKEMGGHAGVFRFQEGNKLAQYPFIKRSLSTLPFAARFTEEYFDITSPYGYGGIYLSTDARDDAQFISRFNTAFYEYCAHEHIVAEFVRFNPLDQNQEAFKDRFKLRHVNDNAIIALDKTEEEIWSDIDKRHRYSVTYARRNQIEIEWDTEWKYFEDFKRLYALTNDRTGATTFYYFSDEFFAKLIKSFPGTVRLAIARRGEAIVAASLFLFNPESVYYFLSGADQNGLSSCANHLMLYTTVCTAKKEGKRFFNFGGGLKIGDSLSVFKSRFSKLSRPFYVGTKIVDESKYAEFVDLSGADKKNSYFPLYRSPDVRR